MPFWREYYIILFDDDHIFVIMYYEKCVVDKMTELPKTLSEYYGYGGTASKISFKAEGVVGIGMALNDIQKDSRLYSGWNRYKVWGMEIYPLGTAIVGWLLNFGGFNGQLKVQSQSCINMLHFMYLWLPMIINILVALLLTQLNVEKANEKLRIQKEIGITK